MKQPFYQKIHKRIENQLSRSGNLRAYLTGEAHPYHRGQTGLICFFMGKDHSFAFVPDGPGPVLPVGLFQIQQFSIPSIGHYEGVVE